MVDPIVEVNRLKHNLRVAGLSFEEVDGIGDLAAQDIDNAIFDLTQSYLNQARDIVSQLGGEQLANELISTKRGAQFIITTDSGITDFSAPPFEMLPHLLKNAKISSKGEMFKVIPLSAGPKKSLTNIFDVYKEHNINARQEVLDRQEKQEDLRTSRAISRKSIHFSGLAQAKEYLAKRQTANKENNNVNSKTSVEFKTASSKQSAAVDWVLPAKDMNITNILNDINSKLEHDVDTTVIYIIGEYGGLV